MSRAYDFAWSRPDPRSLQALGTVSVFRYLGYDTTGKNLSLAEAQRYAAVGISVVSTFEYRPDAALAGHVQGVQDAALGFQQHIDYGGGPDKPIYFSVDVDVADYAPDLPNDDDPAHNRAKLGPIAGYFDAVVAAGGLGRCGAYGGYWAIRRLFRAGLITWGWQTYAWSGDGSGGTLWEPRAQARQVANGVHDLPGIDMDRDELLADVGAWVPTGSPVPTPPPPPPPGPTPGSLPVHAPGSRTLRLTTPLMTGTDVAYLQRFIGPAECGPADGIYGPHTAAGVTWYERMRGMHSVESPGIAGPEVWRNILYGH